MTKLTAHERIVLAIDTPREHDARGLLRIVRGLGLQTVKFGLELSSATSWRACSELAADNNLDWIADAKLDDIPNTIAGAVRAIGRLDHPPIGLTMHTTAGAQAMRAAQAEAGNMDIFGVTVLTSMGEAEAQVLYSAPTDQVVLKLAHNAASAGLQGLVCSPLEVGLVKNDPITSHMVTLVPGVRSTNAELVDQSRVATPAEAIKSGADLLVIGRQVTESKDPTEALAMILAEVEQALGQN